MTISALNRWRLVYLGTAAALGHPLRAVLILGGLCWLAHDLAHERWRAILGDLLALAGLQVKLQWLSIAGIVLAASKPEEAPSPFIWSRWAQPRDASSTPAADQSAFLDRRAKLP